MGKVRFSLIVWLLLFVCLFVFVCFVFCSFFFCFYLTCAVDEVDVIYNTSLNVCTKNNANVLITLK